MNSEIEKSPREIAEMIVNEQVSEVRFGSEFTDMSKAEPHFFADRSRLAAAIEKALRDRDERAAKTAQTPYGDEVQALAGDEPKTVGAKIASAIRGNKHD